MIHKIYKRLLGSIELKAETDLKQYLKTNQALVNYKRPLILRYLNRFMYEQSIFTYLFLYASIIILILLNEFLLKTFLVKIKSYQYYDLININLLALKNFPSVQDILMVQITAMGLIFPIAVGLVTVITQKSNTSNTNSNIQIYYHESMAYKIGASCISLAIVLVLNLFILNFQLWEYTRIKILSSALPFLIPLINTWWLIINLIALWFFLKLSLSFVQPKRREEIRKDYTANVAIPYEKKSIYMYKHYQDIKKSIELGKSDLKIIFGELLKIGETEVRKKIKGEYTLKDVYQKPLVWVLKRWLKRTCFKASHNYELDDILKNSVSFPPLPNQYFSGEIEICNVTGDIKFTAMEKFLIKICFRFKRVKK